MDTQIKAWRMWYKCVYLALTFSNTDVHWVLVIFVNTNSNIYSQFYLQSCISLCLKSQVKWQMLGYLNTLNLVRTTFYKRAQV